MGTRLLGKPTKTHDGCNNVTSPLGNKTACSSSGGQNMFDMHTCIMYTPSRDCLGPSAKVVGCLFDAIRAYGVREVKTYQVAINHRRARS